MTLHPRRRPRRRLPAVAAALGFALGAVFPGAFARAADHIELPDGPGRNLVYGACRTCHDLQYLVESSGIPADAWVEIVDSMRQYGLRIPEERRARIVEYLGTYLGPNPPPKNATEAGKAPEGPVDGATLFTEQCSACHQQSGRGRPGEYPPLAGNRDLMRDRLFPVLVLLNGLEGNITVEGTEYNGQMPTFSHLSDAEIAALVKHVRGAWDNAALKPSGLASVDAATVAKARSTPMSAAEVHAYRAKLK